MLCDASLGKFGWPDELHFPHPRGVSTLILGPLLQFVHPHPPAWYPPTIPAQSSSEFRAERETCSADTCEMNARECNSS